MKPTSLSFASLALLILAGWQAVDALSRTPAFNAALQLEGADGRRYTGYAPTMYDRVKYDQWIANGWSEQARVAMASGDPASGEDALRREREIATRSLKVAPGDPTAWMQLAEAEAGLSQPAEALDALDRAYALAPHSVSRAVMRGVFLTELMEDPAARELALAELDPGMVDADLGLLADEKKFASMARRIRDRLVAHGMPLSPLPEG